MKDINKHGLERYLPPEIKRTVRQRCSFGCVICGTAIIQYHHFDPEFVDATQHNPDGITLLCPTCHEKVKKKFFDADFIKEKNNNPCCKQNGFTKDIFYFGSSTVAFKIGTAWFKRLNVVLYDDEPLISFSPPESENGPLLLNAVLYDKTENKMLTIADNEWVAGIDHFDVETTSNELIIREKLGDIKLRLSHIANKEIFIQKIDMNYKGFRIQVLNNQFIVNSPKGGQLQLTCPNIFCDFKAIIYWSDSGRLTPATNCGLASGGLSASCKRSYFWHEVNSACDELLDLFMNLVRVRLGNAIYSARTPSRETLTSIPQSAERCSTCK